VLTALMLNWLTDLSALHVPPFTAHTLNIAALLLESMILVVCIVLDWVRTAFSIRPGEIVLQRWILRVDETIYQSERIESV
jgi:hypothetical protein